MSKMSENIEESINLLDLPSEVLQKILSFFPDQITVGQVCKKFYDISCRLKTYKLRLAYKETSFYCDYFETSENEEVLKDEEDQKGEENNKDKVQINLGNDEIYESIVNSGRRIVELSLDSHPMDSDRFQKVIEHIGKDVKKLEIRDTILSSFGVEMLNLMPNLEELSFCVANSGVNVTEDFKIPLYNLKKLSMLFSSPNLLKVFDRLPDNVLEELSLFEFDQLAEKGVKYFRNQRSLKRVEIYCPQSSESSFESVHFDQAKLLQLDITTIPNIFQDVFTGQDQMTSLTVCFERPDQNLLNVICEELKSLKSLDLRFEFRSETTTDLSKIQMLRNLKKLKLENISDESIQTLKSDSVEVLEVHDINEEALMSGSVELPNLIEFSRFIYGKSFDIEKFLLFFPKLKRLKTGFEYYGTQMTLSEGWENLSLEYVRINGIPHDTIEFLKRCKALKTLSTDYVSNETLKRLLTEIPSLKTICIRSSVGPDDIETIKQFGQHLDCVHLVASPNFSELLNEWKEILKDQFPVFKFVSDGEHAEFLWKKQGNIMECCE